MAENLHEATRNLRRRVGSNIRRVRDDRGLTQQDVARAMGRTVTSGVVSRWEAGVIPQIDKLVELADVLAVDPGYFWRSDEDPLPRAREIEQLARTIIELTAAAGDELDPDARAQRAHALEAAESELEAETRDRRAQRSARGNDAGKRRPRAEGAG
jgi:transcriptional regulator with XRE-family HTH domain